MCIQDWVQCKGSKAGRRGYTCGLWMLLHSLAANALPEASGGAFWMTAVRYSYPLHNPVMVRVSRTSEPGSMLLRMCGDKFVWDNDCSLVLHSSEALY